MEENGTCKKRFTCGENGTLLKLFYVMLILPWINKFIPIIEKRRKKLKCLIVRFRCNNKIRLFGSPELQHNFGVFVAE